MAVEVVQGKFRTVVSLTEPTVLVQAEAEVADSTLLVAAQGSIDAHDQVEEH